MTGNLKRLEAGLVYFTDLVGSSANFRLFKEEHQCQKMTRPLEIAEKHRESKEVKAR